MENCQKVKKIKDETATCPFPAKVGVDKRNFKKNRTVTKKREDTDRRIGESNKLGNVIHTQVATRTSSG